MSTSMQPSKELLSMLRFQVSPQQTDSSTLVREVATFGSAYYGIVNALREKLEEYIQLKVAELAGEN